VKFRTFFNVLPKEGKRPATVAHRATCRDVSEELTVELVTARLDNKKLREADLVAQFTREIHAARKYMWMKEHATRATQWHGPFIYVSDHDEPSDAELLRWYRANYHGRKP